MILSCGVNITDDIAGYALQDGQSWAAVAVAQGMCNFGSAPISSIALTYMTDAYNEVRGIFVPRGLEDDADKIMTRLSATPWWRSRFRGTR